MRVLWLLLLCSGLLSALPLSLHAAAVRQRTTITTLAPFVPTPTDVVERMLRLAHVGPRDIVYDIGCGDGRIVILAARLFGARGIGIDIDPVRIEESRANARKAAVGHLASFRVEDAMSADFSEATVVTLYLLSASNVALRPRLEAQLKPGSRVVSHSFKIGDWPPQQVDTFADASGEMRTLYLWTIGDR